MADTVDDDIDLRLSGGFSSRSMAGEPSRCHDLTTYTYDSNPVNGSNLELAAKVFAVPGFESRHVPVESGTLVDSLDRSVQLTSRMVGLSTFVNLANMFNIGDTSDVFIKGCEQGGIMGGNTSRAIAEGSKSPEAAFYHVKHRIDVDDVRRLLRTELGPMMTYREEVRKSDQSDLFSTVMDCYYCNYFSRCDSASNLIAESQADTWVPFSDTEFLQTVTRMSLSHHVGSIPLTGGEIPAGTVYPKVELVRRLDSRLAAIPYERTKMPPARPVWQHVAGFVVGISVNRIRERLAGDVHICDGRSTTGDQYRTNRAFRERIDGLLDSACGRPCFDADEIHRPQHEECTGEAGYMSAISGIITGELRVHKHIDREGEHRTASVAEAEDAPRPTD